MSAGQVASWLAKYASAALSIAVADALHAAWFASDVCGAGDPRPAAATPGLDGGVDPSELTTATATAAMSPRLTSTASNAMNENPDSSRRASDVAIPEEATALSR